MNDLFAAEMPSNIALIKYMGKIKGAERNKPTNSSLSFTLNNLLSRVEISPTDGPYDQWATLNEEAWLPTQLSDRGRKRYLAHFEFLKQKMGVKGHYLVKSANNFPSDCGIASSASSFAALTCATYELARSQNKNLDISLSRLADLSRVGSGSSIRSFFSPFVVWDERGASTIEVPTPYVDLHHKIVIVDREKKAIGSSDAHERVTSSLLFEGRPQRAEKRLAELLHAFQVQDWRLAFEIVWAEFWDMHALFATSRPAFQYMTSDSLKILDYILRYWHEKNDGPLVTMDAGANVHFLFRPDQKMMAVEIERDFPGWFT